MGENQENLQIISSAKMRDMLREAGHPRVVGVGKPWRAEQYENALKQLNIGDAVAITRKFADVSITSRQQGIRAVAERLGFTIHTYTVGETLWVERVAPKPEAPASSYQQPVRTF